MSSHRATLHCHSPAHLLVLLYSSHTVQFSENQWQWWSLYKITLSMFTLSAFDNIVSCPNPTDSIFLLPGAMPGLQSSSEKPGSLRAAEINSWASSGRWTWWHPGHPVSFDVYNLFLYDRIGSITQFAVTRIGPGKVGNSSFCNCHGPP